MTSLSPKERFAQLSRSQQEAFVNNLTEEEASALISSWEWEARPNQLVPDQNTLVLAGRGFGKTRMGSEWLIDRIKQGKAKRIALVGRSAADTRDVLVEGTSGLITIARNRGVVAEYQPSKRRVIFPQFDQAQATLFSAEEPDQARGFNFDTALFDELASYSQAKSNDHADIFTNVVMALRYGDAPRWLVTTTPRPTPLIKKLLADSTVHVIRGSTFDNKTNLPDSFLMELQSRYGDSTRLARQELYAEVLDASENALWKIEWIDEHRSVSAPALKRIVVAIDHAVSSRSTSDFTGIVVAGVCADDRYYVLHAEQLRASPNQWGSRAIDLFHEFEADRIAVETNQGGDLIEATLRNIERDIPITQVRASRGKYTRAEPIAALYEQGRVSHTKVFTDLEEQQVLFPDVANDDLVDALVWALTNLADLDSKQPAQLWVL